MLHIAATPDLPEHGGDLAFATARYGTPAKGWLDLSTGINPDPYPFAVRDTDATRLPDPDALAGLIAAARVRYRVPATVGLVAAPGSEIAIHLLPWLAPTGDVAIVMPTYGSHACAWRASGRAVTEIATLEDAPRSAAVIVACNPNNPDGQRMDPAALVHFASRHGLLVVDEAYADTAPEASLMPRLAGAPAVVLRSFGKFYGLPGLRLGFVAGPEAMTQQLSALMGSWPVSGPAIRTATRALADEEWTAATRKALEARCMRLQALLDRCGMPVKGATSLFVLVEHAEAAEIHIALAKRGIWTRIFAERPAWLRIGVPPDEGLQRLERALADLR
jgi:cobalamin biosynthetic protein CobC